MNLKGKRVAQLGTGASGIQVIQEIGDATKHLTIYQRTPNYCLPMNQRTLDPEEEKKNKESGEYEKAFADCRTTFSGFTYDFEQKNTLDVSKEERDKFYHKLLVEEGGFKYSGIGRARGARAMEEFQEVKTQIRVVAPAPEGKPRTQTS